ncbi:MAG: hypothetical protein ABIV94_10095 [Acidimicrobiales bacterium]
MALLDHWPLYGLEVRTPRLALRGPDDDLAQELVDLAERGIHEPGTMPFTVPWTDDPAGAPSAPGAQPFRVDPGAVAASSSRSSTVWWSARRA